MNPPPPGSSLHADALHESGLRHTTGEARYVDDMPDLPGTLVTMLVTSPHAHARITSKDATAARAVPGVAAVLFADAIPGHVLVGPIVHDEPLLALDEVRCVGQVVAAVYGESYEACRAAVALVEVGYAPLPAILTIDEAIAADAFGGAPHVIARGDVSAALATADVVIHNRCSSGAQEHFYLETQAAYAIPGEDGAMHVLTSSQHPTEIQQEVAEVLGLRHHMVVAEVPRMGGAFGGKESQSTQVACIAALGAQALGRPVKLWLDRDTDMCVTGNRHPFQSSYKAGFRADGTLVALEVEIFADGGWTLDLSGPILDRALFHIDNAYWIPALRFTGRVCHTHKPSNTAFRGFGGPQGMLVVEDAIHRFAERTGVDPLGVRRRNYYGDAPRNRAPYGQEITHNRMQRITEELLETSSYAERRREIDAFNLRNPHVRRGIGFQPVKFGISFTKSILNQAGAFVLIYTDGTVQLNHGGTEMGQGLHTKMMAVAAHELGVTPDAVRVMHTSTDKVANTSATAASSGSDLNGQAVCDACSVLRERMRPVAAGLLGALPDRVVFEGGQVFDRAAPESAISFATLATESWLQRVSLCATGFYKTPGVDYDHATGSGTPFYYFAYGAAVTEVEINGLTGEHRILRADMLHDVGASLVPSIDRGQVEGAYIQGVGWLTCEEMIYDDRGVLRTPGPSTYKIPAFGDAPVDFRVALLERAPQPGVVHGSKAVGEPPFMLGISVLVALRHAIASWGRAGVEVELSPPATPEVILRAVEAQRTA